MKDTVNLYQLLISIRNAFDLAQVVNYEVSSYMREVALMVSVLISGLSDGPSSSTGQGLSVVF